MKVKETYCLVDSDTKIRIIDIQEDQIYYINLYEGINYSSKVIRKDSFIDGLYTGNIIKIKDPYLNYKVEELNGKTLDVFKRNWEWIKELWSEYKQELLSKETRNKIIKDFAQEKGCSDSTIKLLLSHFLVRGMNEYSVTPKLNRCGSPGKRRKLTKKPGPKTRPDSPMTQDLEDIFEKSYKKFYLSKPTQTIQSAYEDMVKHYFSANGKIQNNKKPSYHQFWYWIRKQDLKDKVSSKESPNEFNLNHRVLKSSTRSEVTGPGDVFEIDATPLDCHIVSRSNRNKVIGRPILYIIIDRYSHLIVGMNVGLYGPSWIGAVGAFENMVEDKVAFCSRFGIEISPEDWPVKDIIPYSVIGDRGEMISKNSDELIKNLSINLKNTSPYRGDLKPNVERSFGVINKKIRERIEGAVIKEYRKRGDSDPRDKAKLNLEEITRVCIHCVLYFNKRIIKDFPLSEDQIAFDIPAQPLSLWNFGINHYLDSLTEVDGRDFRKSLLPTIKRTTNKRGINFKNVVYTVPDIKSETWLINHQNEEVTFAYDPLDISEGYFRTKDHQEIRMVLSDTFSSFSGMTFEELKRYDELRKEKQKILEDFNLENRIELNTSLDKINNSVPKPDSKVSKASRKKNIKENRKLERMNKTDVITENKGIIQTDEQAPLVNNYDAIDKVLELSEKNGKS